MSQPNISKKGVWYTDNFYESWAEQIQINTQETTTYTPTTGTNSCISESYRRVMFTDYAAGDSFAVTITVKYSGFDTSNTSGTFAIRFQGTNYTTSAAAWQWAGTNPINTALNSARALTTEVLSKTSGTYTYKTYFTLNSTFRNTYSGSSVGVRSDYSNGTATLTITDFVVTPLKSTNYVNKQAKIGDSYVTANQLYEI